MLSACKNIFRFGLGLIVATLLFEGVLRTVETTPLWKVLPVAEGAFYGPDPLAGYTLRAGASGIWLKENRARHIVNSHGMLDRDVTLKTDAFRVAVLGDSKTEALQVDRASTFVGQAQSALSTDDHPVEVLNFGLAGATPAVMAARLEGLAAKFAPDLIVILVSMGDFSSPFMGNDSKFAGYVSSGGGVKRGVAFRDTAAYQFRTSSLGEITYSLISSMRVLSVLNSRKNVGLFAELTSATPTPINPTFEQERQIATAAKYKNLWIDREPRENWDRAAAFFADVDQQRRRLNAKMIVGFMGMDRLDGAFRDQLIAKINKAFHPIRIVDFEEHVSRNLPADTPMPRLSGFKGDIGQGHLNFVGHRVYGKTLAALLAPYVQQGRNRR